MNAEDRLTQLTTGPMTRTLHGIRRRLELLNCDDLSLLCRHYQCDIGRLEAEFWADVRPRPRRSRKNLRSEISEGIT